MKIKILALLISLVFGVAAQAATLKVVVNGVRSGDGAIRIALFNQAQGFPKQGSAVQTKLVEITGGSLATAFKDLAPGKYAIALFHDENGNGELDTNVFGVPKEGYAFSNNARGTLTAPKFAAAAFLVGDANVRLEVSLGY